MLINASQPHRTARHSHAIVSNPHDRIAARGTTTRPSQRWQIFGRRDEISLAQRCLALHLHFAGPHSALD